MKRGSEEGWAPNNYLELVPSKPKSAPPPAKRPPPSAPKPVAAPKPTTNASIQKLSSTIADVNARPVAVFPGLTPGNGSATPWKKTAASTATGSETHSASNVTAKPSPPPPTVAKNKPTPPIAAKPPAKTANKPPIPTAPRPPAGGGPSKPGAVKPPPAATGQIDLATLVSFFASSYLISCLVFHRWHEEQVKQDEVRQIKHVLYIFVYQTSTTLLLAVRVILDCILQAS